MSSFDFGLYLHLSFSVCFSVHPLMLSSSNVTINAKVKVKLFMCLTKHNTMNVYGGVEV